MTTVRGYLQGAPELGEQKSKAGERGRMDQSRQEARTQGKTNDDMADEGERRRTQSRTGQKEKDQTRKRKPEPRLGL